MPGMVIYKQPAKAPPCRAACPAGIDVPRYVRLIGEGKFDDALAVVLERTPFPSVCGRVCPAPCEGDCRLNDLGSPVAIRALKRFVADRGVRKAPELAGGKDSGKRVAVVGAGPAGLTAAYYLAKKGHRVVVFESLPEAGGMMRWGIPEFSLPRTVLEGEIKSIVSAGVELRTGSPVRSLKRLREQGYDAVFVAVGAWAGVKLGIPGEEGKGVVSALEFLRKASSGEPVPLGERTAVVGGGNSALDAARAALRAGSGEVSVVYRRSWREMPAGRANVSEAELEGVKFRMLASPVEVVRKNGMVTGIRCLRVELGQPDASGRCRPLPVAGSEFDIECDSVIVAVGEGVDGASIEDLGAVQGEDGGCVIVNAKTLETGMAGVFAGGDVVTGPATVIQAIAMGRRAAASVDRFLGGSGDVKETLALAAGTVEPTSLQGFPVGERQVMPEMAVKERLAGFSEVELGLSQEGAVAEAGRCLRCDLPIRVDTARCLGCLTCAMYCSLRTSGAFNPLKAAVQVVRCGPGDHEYEMAVGFTAGCIDCGLCARYCPYGAITREIDQAYLETQKRPGPSWEGPARP